MNYKIWLNNETLKYYGLLIDACELKGNYIEVTLYNIRRESISFLTNDKSIFDEDFYFSYYDDFGITDFFDDSKQFKDEIDFLNSVKLNTNETPRKKALSI
jgi:hypothetical protein